MAITGFAVDELRDLTAIEIDIVADLSCSRGGPAQEVCIGRHSSEAKLVVFGIILRAAHAQPQGEDYGNATPHRAHHIDDFQLMIATRRDKTSREGNSVASLDQGSTASLASRTIQERDYD
ncbi:hypothetical protein HYQ46_008519 [Verticillium longisporum]|nr:hypothetical protein HYQ46_008519 [Verticillium longisporum]